MVISEIKKVNKVSKLVQPELDLSPKVSDESERQLVICALVDVV